MHCEKTGPGKIRQIFIISRGHILVQCPSVSDSLSTGLASGDNSDINARFNQLCISLVIDSQNISPVHVVFRKMNELRNFNGTNGF